jgi:hypothetical protein
LNNLITEIALLMKINKEISLQINKILQSSTKNNLINFLNLNAEFKKYCKELNFLFCHIQYKSIRDEFKNINKDLKKKDLEIKEMKQQINKLFEITEKKDLEIKEITEKKDLEIKEMKQQINKLFEIIEKRENKNEK